MKKQILLLFISCMLKVSGIAQITPENQSAPIKDVQHEQKLGYLILTNGDSLAGKITYFEYNSDKLYYFKKDGENYVKEGQTFNNMDTIKRMYIEGRGLFVNHKVSEEKSKLMHVIEDNESYVEYEYFNAVKGLLGVKFSGGGVEGHYSNYLLIKKNNKLVIGSQVKSLKKNINEYVDYCDEITDKVKSEAKGYKTSLIKPAYFVLKKVVREAYTECLQ